MPPSFRILVLCNTSLCLISRLLLSPFASVLMQRHNPSLKPRILIENSCKLRNKELRQLMFTKDSHRGTLAEVPTVLFRSSSLILNKPPDTLIIIANNKAIKVKVRLHTLNELLKLPPEGTNDCFLGT